MGKSKETDQSIIRIGEYMMYKNFFFDLIIIASYDDSMCTKCYPD